MLALAVVLALTLSLLPSAALAGWGDDPWGVMLWGESASVPALPSFGLIALSTGLSATAAWLLRKRRRALGLPMLLVLLSVPLLVAAGTLDVPNTFVNGQIADADQVNANFDAVATSVNDNDSRITSAAADAATAQSAANAAIASAAGAQSTADANASQIAAHDTNISTLAIAVSGNVSAIASNDTDIAANTEAITANDTDITTNTAAIAAHDDGVFEISQTCASSTGCFTGDAPGFPVTLIASGSYRLTSNLTVPDENTDGIQVSSPSIRIDLNGFAISGPVTCSGGPLSCTPASGTGSAVKTVSPSAFGTLVANGSITGMGAYGVLVGPFAVVTNLYVHSNRLDGIFILEGSAASSNLVSLNGGVGIAGTGIHGSRGSTVSGNTVYFNALGGISTSTGSTVSNNTVYANTGDGIFAETGSAISGNTVHSNSGAGLSLGADASYRDNTVTGNGAGIVLGVNRGGNYCSGIGVVSADCP